jgi:hypothetical protein
MGFSSVWWALGPLLRGDKLNEQIVVRLRTQGIQCGFTAQDPAAIIRILTDKVTGEFMRLVQM